VSLVEIELQRACRSVEVDVGTKGYIDATNRKKECQFMPRSGLADREILTSSSKTGTFKIARSTIFSTGRVGAIREQSRTITALRPI